MVVAWVVLRPLLPQRLCPPILWCFQPSGTMVSKSGLLSVQRHRMVRAAADLVILQHCLFLAQVLRFGLLCRTVALVP